MAHICLIESWPEDHAPVKQHLGEFYEITAAISLREAKGIIDAQAIDLVLLNVDLVDGSGLEFCLSLKRDLKTQALPVVFLTEKVEPTHKMAGFSMGADDYIGKPLEPLETRARIEACLRRRNTLRSFSSHLLKKGPLHFDSLKQRAYFQLGDAEKDLQLTPREFRLLYLLAANEGTTFSRVELMSTVVEANVHISQETVYTHISAIRRKLGSLRHIVQCQPRAGYRLVFSEK